MVLQCLAVRRGQTGGLIGADRGQTGADGGPDGGRQEARREQTGDPTGSDGGPNRVPPSGFSTILQRFCNDERPDRGPDGGRRGA
jgi:hypothetical protein